MSANPQFLDTRLPPRFWSKVQPCPMSGCWLWTASTRNGYGQFGLRDGRVPAAHRLAYLTLVGQVPPGLELDHLCRVRCCVNPAHLEPVTTAENTRRGMCSASIRARYAAITLCPNGHPYGPENTYEFQRRSGYRNRVCRACIRIMRGKRRARRRQVVS